MISFLKIPDGNSLKQDDVSRYSSVCFTYCLYVDQVMNVDFSQIYRSRTAVALCSFHMNYLGELSYL